MDIQKQLNCTLLPTETWKKLSLEDRAKKIQLIICDNDLYKDFELIDAADDGHIIFCIDRQIDARDRGTILLNLEETLKDTVDVGLTVWLQPTGDKSKLRNLRGVKVKS